MKGSERWLVWHTESIPNFVTLGNMECMIWKNNNLLLNLDKNELPATERTVSGRSFRHSSSLISSANDHFKINKVYKNKPIQFLSKARCLQLGNDFVRSTSLFNWLILWILFDDRSSLYISCPNRRAIWITEKTIKSPPSGANIFEYCGSFIIPARFNSLVVSLKCLTVYEAMYGKIWEEDTCGGVVSIAQGSGFPSAVRILFSNRGGICWVLVVISAIAHGGSNKTSFRVTNAWILRRSAFSRARRSSFGSKA